MNNNNVFDLLEADLRQAVEALHYTQPTPCLLYTSRCV